MQKVMDFLEKNVEWFALGLGGLFFMYMAWTYLIASPVSKPVGSNNMTPGNVDDFNAKIAAELQSKIGNTAMPPFVVDSFRDSVINGLTLDSLHPPELAMIWNAQRSHTMDTATSSNPGSTTEPGGATAVVQSLPTLPAATPLLVETGRTTVLKTPGSSPTDIAWTTCAFAIPLAPLANEWNAAFGGTPAKLSSPSTVILSATAMRSEKLPDGTWSSETPVPRLANNTLLAYPAPDAPKLDQDAYRVMAARQGPDITTPKFYDPAPPPSGTIWRDPAELLRQKAKPGTITTALTPAAGPPIVPGAGGADAPPPGVPPEAWAQMLESRRMAQQSMANGGDQSGSPDTPAAPTTRAIDAKPIEPTVVFAEGVPGNSIPVPLTRTFNPSTAGMSDILVYLHDETVRPGKTYRYRLVYKLLNPLFVKHDPTLAANPALSTQFDLVSHPGQYSPEIGVQQRTYFFCAKPSRSPGDKQAFAFDVFTWANGNWKKHTFTVNPGDAIGTTVDGADFSTGYTFVDGRTRNTNTFLVTIVDDDGVAQVKDAQRDFNSAEHKANDQNVGSGNVAPTSRPAAAPTPAPAPPRRAGSVRPPTNYGPPGGYGGPPPGAFGPPGGGRYR